MESAKVNSFIENKCQSLLTKMLVKLKLVIGPLMGCEISLSPLENILRFLTRFYLSFLGRYLNIYKVMFTLHNIYALKITKKSSQIYARGLSLTKYTFPSANTC